MARRPVAILILGVLSVGLAACTSSAKTAAPTTTVSTTTTTLPIIPLIGSQYVYVMGVHLNQPLPTITVDPIEYLTGAAAVAEFKKLNPEAKEGPPNDYVIVNAKVEKIVLPLAADAVVRVVEVKGAPHTDPVVVPQSALVHYSGLGSRPFQITVNHGTVNSVTERFVP